MKRRKKLKYRSIEEPWSVSMWEMPNIDGNVKQHIAPHTLELAAFWTKMQLMGNELFIDSLTEAKSLKGWS